MIISSENMALANVWSMTTDPAYNQLRTQGYAAFLTDDQKARLERILQARQLFQGKHRAYYLDGGRTAFDFPYVKSNGRSDRMYLTYNVLGLIAIKGADLLFSQAPLFDCPDPDQFAALTALQRRTQLHAVLLNGAITAASEAEVFLEACVHTDGQVYIRAVPNETIFPVGDVGPDGQYSTYVRYLIRNAGTTDTPFWLLLQTTLTPGLITRACWQLDATYKKIKQLVLAAWDPAMEGQDSTPTGVALNTIVWVPNFLGRAISDSDCAIPLQDALNAKNTQISRVLQKHSDPKLAAPIGIQDPQGNLPAAAETFFFSDPNMVPKYITWNAELASAITDRAFALNQLLVRTETSPSLLGLKEGAAPDSYKKVRLESFNSLSKAARKAIIWTGGVQRILDAAMALENTLPGVGYPVDPIGVTLRDGIPIDDLDQATTIATLRTAGVMSVRRGVQAQLGDDAAVDSEMAELKTEAEQATPSVLFSEPHPDATYESPAVEPPEGGDKP